MSLSEPGSRASVSSSDGRVGRGLTPRTAPLSTGHAGLDLTFGIGAVLVATTLFVMLAEDVITNDAIVTLDHNVFVWLQLHSVPAVTTAMLAVTHMHSTLGVLLMALAFAGWLAWRRYRHWLLALALVVPAGMVVNVVLKQAFRRARPSVGNPLLVPSTYSFPSGHTAAAVLFYGLLAAFATTRIATWRGRALCAAAAVAMVALVGFSRMYLGVHYLSDVVGAALEGLAWLALCLTAVNTLAGPRLARSVSPLTPEPHDPTTLCGPTAAGRGGLPVIINPGSGSGHDDADARRIVAAFDAVGLAVAVYSPRAEEDLSALVTRVMQQNPTVVVGGGGDGTISTVAAGLAGTDTALGVLPLGTLNHFAKDLAIPLDLEGAVRVIAAGHRVAVDVGEVNGRVFINNSSLGLYPDIVRDRELQQRRLGRAKWAAFWSASIAVLRRYPFLDVAMQLDGHPEARRTGLVFIGNNEYVLEGFDIGSRPRLDQGTLGVYVTRRCGRAGLFLLALRALCGRLHKAHDLEAVRCHTMTVETRRPRLRVAADGEVVMMETPLRYRARPGALNVLVAALDPEGRAAGATS